VEAESENKLRVLRTDRSGEFTSVEFATYCVDQGVVRHHTMPYSPQQNGVEEQRNQTVADMARSMMKAKSMPAVLILNRAPTMALKGVMLFKARYWHKRSVSFLRMFGCIGHVKKTKPVLTKLEDRSTPMVLLGYEEGTKAYRLYDPRGGKVVFSRDLMFDKKAT